MDEHHKRADGVPRSRNYQMIECVPNFSEGRDQATLAALQAAVRGVGGVKLLGATADYDHHRSVLTFAGPADLVAQAAFETVRVAVDCIDLNRHEGVHPRTGAADVVPFVPLKGATLAECVRVAGEVAERIWHELRVPVYLYEAAARQQGRERLENVRRGGWERLRHAAIADPSRAPDIGGPALHPTAGASIVGARRFLVAWNVNLASSDVRIARQIARTIRESSGGLAGVKALGLELHSAGLVQVSMNLTDFERTPLGQVYGAIERAAREAGVAIAGAELIGFLPRAAYEQALEAGIPFEDFGPHRTVEHWVDQ